MLIELLKLLGSVVMLIKMYRNLTTYRHLKKKKFSFTLQDILAVALRT